MTSYEIHTLGTLHDFDLTISLWDIKIFIVDRYLQKGEIWAYDVLLVDNFDLACQ